ncbi:hypothetical protein C8Q78DRAFT_170487 [Trametes maxima]|nr:hypothetical protein C8Q78DRAFT_170487 [Trametes maxima]
MQGTSDWDSGPGSGSGWSQETTAERANDRCSHAPAGSLFLLPLALRRIQSSLVSVVSRRGIPRAIAPRRHCSRSQNRLSQDRYNLPFPLCCVSAVWDQIIALASAAAARYPSVHVLAAAALRAGACGPGHAQGPTAIARVLPCGYETDRRWAQLPMTFRARPRPICTLDSRRTTSDVLEGANLPPLTAFNHTICDHTAVGAHARCRSPWTPERISHPQEKYARPQVRAYIQVPCLTVLCTPRLAPREPQQRRPPSIDAVCAVFSRPFVRAS